MYKVNQDISRAETLPSSFYRDKINFQHNTDVLISKSWQFIGDDQIFGSDQNAIPLDFMPEIIDEPLLLVKSANDIKCFSNVCTHRGNLLITEPGKHSRLICGYHGRKFGLDGQFESMPEFESAEDFPRPCEDLAQVNIAAWHQLLFINLTPHFDFSLIADALNERVGFLPIRDFKLDAKHGQTYQVKAHWALYCDNFLEGFHIPFVHPELNQSVEFSTYETVLYDYCNVQIGYSKDGTEAFDLPEGHPDFGKQVAAYYYWIFPNLMLNFYPWGLSVNIIEPIDAEHTRVRFISYVYDETKIDNSAGALLNEVEMEDEEVVQNVHKGMKSRFYKTGRFSPSREQGVHHFHSLISNALSET